jgi:predicted aconitase
MSIHDIRKYSELLKGKKVRSNVTVWLMSSAQNIYLAKQEGYIDILEQAGVTVLTTCPINNPGIPGPNHTSINKEYSIGNFATNSMKLLYYSRNSFRPKKTFFGSTEQCIQAAVSGTWEC